VLIDKKENQHIHVHDAMHRLVADVMLDYRKRDIHHVNVVTPKNRRSTTALSNIEAIDYLCSLLTSDELKPHTISDVHDLLMDMTGEAIYKRVQAVGP
jgi:hypothetical protein